jgi:hypothetical protein
MLSVLRPCEILPSCPWQSSASMVRAVFQAACALSRYRLKMPFFTPFSLPPVHGGNQLTKNLQIFEFEPLPLLTKIF